MKSGIFRALFKYWCLRLELLGLLTQKSTPPTKSSRKLDGFMDLETELKRKISDIMIESFWFQGL